MNKKEIKMTVENYNNVMQQLDKIQISSGIANAQAFLNAIQLMNNIEVIEEQPKSDDESKAKVGE